MIEHLFLLVIPEYEHLVVYEAWVWIPILLLGGVTIFFGAYLLSLAATAPLKKNKIAVLGMPGAGKTTFYNMLQGKHISTTPTYEEDIDSFVYKINGRDVHFDKCKDIGGGESHINNWYLELIDRNEVVFFFFDVYKFLNESPYQQNTMARMDFVYETTKRVGGRETAMILTHLDSFPKSKFHEILPKVQKAIGNKEYQALFKRNVFCVDITREKEVKKIMEKLFSDNN